MGRNEKKENITEKNVEEINTENKITKEDLEARIRKGDFRIARNFVFKDGSKELRVDYKDTDRNYLLEENKLIEYFKEKYPHQEFFILGE